MCVVVMHVRNENEEIQIVLQMGESEEKIRL